MPGIKRGGGLLIHPQLHWEQDLPWQLGGGVGFEIIVLFSLLMIASVQPPGWMHRAVPMQDPAAESSCWQVQIIIIIGISHYN